MIGNKEQVNLSLAIILLCCAIPTIPRVLVAFSVLKVCIHDLHSVAIADILDSLPFCISLSDSVMSYQFVVLRVRSGHLLQLPPHFA